jgi:hypothetical protein
MKESIKNFIGVYENYIPKKMCDDAIQFFKKEDEMKNAFTRLQSENCPRTAKADLQVGLMSENINFWFKDFKILLTNFDVVLNKYLTNIDLAKHYQKDFHYTSIKIQRTLPGEGYHIWHIEHGLQDCLNRVLAYCIYLNDVEEGGETEFLHQSVRVKPTTGTIVIWPAWFPYVHRGNPPLKGEKYILTSWICV